MHAWLGHFALSDVCPHAYGRAALNHAALSLERRTGVVHLVTTSQRADNYWTPCTLATKHAIDNAARDRRQHLVGCSNRQYERTCPTAFHPKLTHGFAAIYVRLLRDNFGRHDILIQRHSFIASHGWIQDHICFPCLIPFPTSGF